MPRERRKPRAGDRRPLAAETVLIERNRQREKTASERMREAEHLAVIERARAKERQGTRTDLNLPANWPEGETGETREKIAEQVGLSAGTYRRIKSVWDAATDDAAAPEVRDVAREQRAALDAGALSAHGRGPPFGSTAR